MDIFYSLLLHVYTCKYIPKYDYLSLYIVYMHVIMTDHLVLDNQLCSSLGKNISSSLSTPKLPGVLCVVLSPHNLFLFLTDISIVVIVIHYFGSHVSETLCMYLVMLL